MFCSGKILHIDFGDCFEASMNREKFPEKVCPKTIFEL
jgi:phosphatidylinositol kinase/protein kinase (PI-3  family)